ncbi:hypothetical protein [Kitasatospora purpeofusca]|uniref:hypothetical protein n=1 Tax=Kitasatospora purpeofusca TaxID=67352 RepID=UPI002A5A555C|nr:hypothetical protein [Kitasatospora purpeofusca]MDY0810633.1 hypothetical protein [Kitasatospora purpeofusca]
MSIGLLPKRSVGIRSADEIQGVLHRLRARRDKPRVRGARAALRWALDPWRAPPLAMEPAPPADALLRLMTQERTALAVRYDAHRSPEERRQARGVAQALGWVLGYSPDPPV